MQPPPTSITYTQCNRLGVMPGACPVGFACTGTEVTPIDATHSFTRAVCEPSQATIPPLLIDLAPPSGVAVHFDVTLNGGAWPTSATRDAAGRISFLDQRSGTVFSRLLPTQPGGLDATLPPGTYDVSLDPFTAGFDMAHYPTVPLRGTLVVAAAGSVQLDLTGQPITLDLRLDGAAFPALAAGNRVTLRLAGYHAQDLRIDRFGPADTAAVVMLEPDTYQVTLDADTALDTPGFPVGTVVLADQLQVTSAATATFDIPSFPVGGAVRIDGADLPAGSFALVSFGGKTGVRVTSAAPSRYQARLLAGTYDVVFVGPSPAGGDGATRVRSSFTAGPTTLDINVTTTTFAGSVTLNGAAPAAAARRGTLALGVPGTPYVPQQLSITKTGAATWSGRVFAGTYDVQLQGDVTLPSYRAVLEPDLAILTPVSKSYNLGTGTLNVTFTGDGARPPDATFSRGFVRLTSVDGPARSTAIELPVTGPSVFSSVLEAGTWAVEYVNNEGYTGLPAGRAALGTVSVAAGGATTTTLDARTITVTGELQRDGQPPGPAPGGRGTVSVFNNSGAAELPATGPATFSIRSYAGVLDLGFSCAACGDGQTPASEYLLYGVRYP
jgi:hypothetical protein